MTDTEWFAWCFLWWRERKFVLDNERAPIDYSDRIPPEGWVT